MNCAGVPKSVVAAVSTNGDFTSMLSSALIASVMNEFVSANIDQCDGMHPLACITVGLCARYLLAFTCLGQVHLA